jgi:hypothetical protein
MKTEDQEPMEPTALQAHEAAVRTHNDFLVKVLKNIQKAADNGKFSIQSQIPDEHRLSAIKHVLGNLGYDVIVPEDGSAITVSWSQQQGG